jgi:hypothetical protein
MRIYDEKNVKVDILYDGIVAFLKTRVVIVVILAVTEESSVTSGTVVVVERVPRARTITITLVSTARRIPQRGGHTFDSVCTDVCHRLVTPPNSAINKYMLLKSSRINDTHKVKVISVRVLVEYQNHVLFQVTVI